MNHCCEWLTTVSTVRRRCRSALSAPDDAASAYNDSRAGIRHLASIDWADACRAGLDDPAAEPSYRASGWPVSTFQLGSWAQTERRPTNCGMSTQPMDFVSLSKGSA